MEVLLVGNKNDLEEKRMVSKEEGERFAKENNLVFIEINTKVYIEVEKAFKMVAKAILQKITEGKLPMHTQVIIEIFRIVESKLEIFQKMKRK